MLSRLSPQERNTYLAMASLTIIVFVAISYLQKPAPAKITFENLGPKVEKKAIEESQSQELVVHVTGAVKKPGVYRLKPDSRVHDAIRVAGGAKQNPPSRTRKGKRSASPFETQSEPRLALRPRSRSAKSIPVNA